MTESSANTRRIIALFLPRLPTDRLKRRWQATGRRDERPLVVAAKIDNALRLTAVDAKAAKLGLVPGKALSDARGMIPDLAVTGANEKADLKLLEGIADWCERYTPFCALDAPDGLFLDATGAAHLFGGESAMLAEIRRAITAQGFAVRLALAGTPAAARALARHASGTVVAPGGEAEAVAQMPVETLRADRAIVHALRRAGLRTIGQIAQRQRSELTARFGGAFVALLDCALGTVQAPISPRNPLPDCMAERRFAEPIVTEAVIAETILSLATGIASVLEKRGQGARRIEACFFRADGAVRRIAIETGAAVRDPAVVARLFRERLDALSDPLDPGFGFDLIRLGASHVQASQAPATGFDTNENDRDIAFLVDRLAARFGRHRVSRFLQQDSHVPEAEVVTLPAQEAPRLAWKTRTRGEAPRRPLRLFAKPEPIEVLSEVPDGAPLRFRWRRAAHNVSRAEGPERIAMQWWRRQEEQPTRDYFRVEDEQGRRFWLYRDGIPAREMAHPRWYVHGVFA
jgi:protein ImuB